MLKTLFRKETPLQRHQRQIEDILKTLEMKPEDHRVELDDENELAWVVGRGSIRAGIRIFWDAEGGIGWFSVEAPLVRLPDDNLLPFYRKLLDLNGEYPGVTLQTRGDVVYLDCGRPLDGLDPTEAEEILHRVTGIADELDDLLAEEFDAPLYEPE